ncbi:adenosylcobyric acid synthase (glutamine-hydrolysing) [Methylobacterium phyllostachyos]|uniref:Cobyric acid synthase n=1 Tax=Methylobacterium phyllostachyos TaxID=582672 RepID=A0A1H0HHE7_9HYPH|nr:cobyric acid synthase [Methylobacterium phyllostachyos]SDO18520.1 adenosylcobyric acid synthase (glutamine-hydrolysing) [Methylobacterium phyllostachyos]
MIQGTGSDVGKSLLVAGLARAFTERGLRVRPFKPQNMSNNAAVTQDGGEIGRAQALQARAARVAPSVHMNPVLLKPQSEVGSQVVVQGRMVATVKARDYQAWKPRLMSAVLESFSRLGDEADLILVEGAGSASEVNLRAGDIANMGFARATDTPVVLVGDIDRGGVIASLVGTKAVIDPDDAAMIAGFIVNRFRGDPSLFADGMRLIADKTGWAALGLVPHFPAAARLPAEDVLGLAGSEARGKDAVTVAVPVLPRIANFDDLDPLRAEPGVSVVLVRPGTPIPAEAALVLLPGSKTTIDDLEAFRQEGWDIDLRAHVRRGGRVLGLCGGYQMLGQSLADPHGIEGAPRTVPGLGLLDVETVMTPEKRLVAVTGTSLPDGVPFSGYEMHIGATAGPDAARPLLRLADGRLDGAVSADGRVAGTYVHGLFADDAQRAAWLARLGTASAGAGYEAGVEAALDGLARHIAAHVDCDRLLALAR